MINVAHCPSLQGLRRQHPATVPVKLPMETPRARLGDLSPYAFRKQDPVISSQVSIQDPGAEGRMGIC